MILSDHPHAAEVIPHMPCVNEPCTAFSALQVNKFPIEKNRHPHKCECR